MNNYPNNFRPYFNPVFYKTMPVMSETEINNVTVDFNGTPTYFHNQATNEIYVKQFDMRTGITSVQRYVKSEHDSKPVNESKEDEGINTLKNDLTSLNDRVGHVETMLDELKEKGVKK